MACKRSPVRSRLAPPIKTKDGTGSHSSDSHSNGQGPAVITEASRLIWDWPVRLVHWALVLAVSGAYLTNRLGIEYFKYHVWCGYAVIVLVVFRIAWGLVGTNHARFINFVRGPRATSR